jgi:hypothetical protein
MSEKKITGKQVRRAAYANGVEIKRRNGKWEFKNYRDSTGLWEWAGETNEQAAQFLADQFTADHSVESLLRQTAKWD